jgi:hypothetical protein
MHVTGPVLGGVSLLLGLVACGEADSGLARIDDPTADPPRVAATIDWHRGAPEGAKPEQRAPVDASWLADGFAIRITVWGSSSCPPAGRRAFLSDDRRSVTLILRSYDGACTDDLSPTTSVVKFPESVESRNVQRVVVKGGTGPPRIVRLYPP